MHLRPRPFLRHWPLVRALARRELLGRYRGTLFGPLWPWFTPILMLAVFTFVFGKVMGSRWQELPDGGLGGFALLLLSGLLLHGFLAEVLSRAPGLIVSNPNYVTKVVFPLEILVLVDVRVAAAHLATGIAVVLAANALWGSGLHAATLALPLILLPLALLVTGLAWGLAALGVYVRDLAQLLPPLLTAMLFLGPVFYPRQQAPALAQAALAWNPLTVPVEQLRAAIFIGEWPDWSTLALYTLTALLVFVTGGFLFMRMKRGFADVL